MIASFRSSSVSNKGLWCFAVSLKTCLANSRYAGVLRRNVSITAQKARNKHVAKSLSVEISFTILKITWSSGTDETGWRMNRWSGALLLIWIKLNPSMCVTSVLFIPKLQRLHRWGLGMDKTVHPALNYGCNYLSMLDVILDIVLGHSERPKKMYFAFHVWYQLVYSYFVTYIDMCKILNLRQMPGQ